MVKETKQKRRIILNTGWGL